MIKLSMWGLADYMTSNPAKQRSILRQYKYPGDDEARAKVLYYREARDIIAAYHGGDCVPDWLEERAIELDSLARLSTGRTKTRLRHNSRTIRDYAETFAGRKFEILQDVRLTWEHGGVRVSVVPDLHVREKRIERIIKLGFAKDEPDPARVKIAGQLMYQAAEDVGMGLNSAGVLFLDIARGLEYRGARAGSRTIADLQAACETIRDVWERL